MDKTSVRIQVPRVIGARSPTVVTNGGSIVIRSKVAIGLVGLALIGANLGVAVPASASETVVVSSDQTNIAALVPASTNAATTTATAAGNYVVLRDNFYTFSTCESYRKWYANNYPYVIDSYCTTNKQSNGRHWLYVWYDNCPDIVATNRAVA